MANTELNEAPQRATDLEYSSTTVVYKEQGNGTDSWVINYFDDKGNQIFSEIVYKDPTKADTETTEKTLAGLTDENIVLLWGKLIDFLDKLPIELLNKLTEKLTK